MEFNFKLNDLFKEPIVKITSTLLPPGFTGDRRAVSYEDIIDGAPKINYKIRKSTNFCEEGIYKRIEPPPMLPALQKIRECQTKVADVINTMGLASAAAQGLTKPITTSDKLRNSDHIVYLLIDLQDGSKGNGCVTGLLKVGRKSLYIFDPAGCHHQLKPLCVLDFYIHESRQRTGLGRRLFEHMLKEEDVEAVRLAIDRPSKKFLGFLSKHYNLNRVVPQMNNFVVFEGFFVPMEGEENGQNNNRINLMANYKSEPGSKLHNGLHTTPNITAPTLGRYGAPRPPCSMGQIIHNQSPQLGPNDSSGSETETSINEEINNTSKLERPRSLSINTTSTHDEQQQSVQLDQLEQQPPQPQPPSPLNNEPLEDCNVSIKSADNDEIKNDSSNIKSSDMTTKDVEIKCAEMKIDEQSQQSEQTNHKTSTTPKNPNNNNRLTEQGHLDLKFYHSKLW